MRRAVALSLSVTLGVGLAACEDDAPDPAAAKARAEALAREAEAAAARVDPGHEAEAQRGPRDLAGTLGAMEKAMKGKIVPQKVRTRPVAPEAMQAALPASLKGLSAAKLEGQPAAGGVSIAAATYAAGEASIRAQIMDIAGLEGVAAVARTGWAAAEVDRETPDGYERSGEIGGHPSFEMLDRGAKRAELRILVARRFLVDVTGQGVDVARVRAAAEAIDLSALAALKDRGRLVNPKAE